MQPLAHSQANSGIPVYSEKRAGSVDGWIDHCGRLFGIAPLCQDDTKKDYTSAAWFIDPITVGRSMYCDMAASHHNWHTEESGGQIHVHRYASGRASVQTEGIPIECDTGAVTLLDYGRKFTSLHTDNDCQSFFVPYDAIGYQPSDLPHALVYAAHTMMGNLIGTEMDNLLTQLENGAQTVDPADVKRFLGCVEVAMQPETASPSASAQMRLSLKRTIQVFIEERLSSPTLDTTLILRNFGVSRASLYRMFEAENGVRAYINYRRLMRAVVDLAAAPTQRGLVNKVSERWGFTSAPNFNRMVKREFGVTPGSLFQMPIHYTLDPNPSSSVQAMMLERAKAQEQEVAAV